MSQVMRQILGSLEVWWNDMPEAWQEIETGLTFDTLLNLLSRFEQNPRIFWKTS